MKNQKLYNWLLWLVIGVSFLGFLDATYLTVSHYTGAELSCGLTGGCGEVTSSKYATIVGIPIALLGGLYYLSVFILTFLYRDFRKPIFLTLIALLSTTGFLASLFLVYLQVFVIEALCQYCIFSALSSTILFICSIFLFRNRHSA